MAKVLNGAIIPNLTWEEAPKDYEMPIWRYSKNPITKRNPFPNIDRIFNSALVPWKDGFIGVFRCDRLDGIPQLFLGHSRTGTDIEIEKEPIHFLSFDGAPLPDRVWGYDPRLVKIGDDYFVVWCDELGNAPTIGIAKTNDFVHFYKYDAPFIPANRNGVLFPRKINGRYYMLSRPSDCGHTPFGDIYISESKDLEYWGKHRLLLKRDFNCWSGLKIGGGPAPIETDEGWLTLIHGVQNSCNGFVYAAGVILLDKEDPTKVLAVCKDPILLPTEPYEMVGFTSNVVFPTSILTDGETGRMAIYYGCADTCTSICFTTVDRLLSYLKAHRM